MDPLSAARNSQEIEMGKQISLMIKRPSIPIYFLFLSFFHLDNLHQTVSAGPCMLTVAPALRNESIPRIPAIAAPINTLEAHSKMRTLPPALQTP